MDLQRRDLLKAVGGVAALAAGGSATGWATADPGTELDRSLVREYLANDDLLDNDELERIIQGFEGNNPDLVTLETIGESNQGRPLHSVTVRDPECEDPTHVMAIASQHGDEILIDEGMLSALQFLTSGDSRAEAILSEVAVHVVVRVNPDGFVARQRFNVDTDAPADDPESDIFSAENGIFAAEDEGIGWDINRYNSHDWTQHELYQSFPDEYPENPVPEARAVIGMVQDVDPEWIIDFHRQGSYVVDYESEFDVDEVIADAEDDDDDDDDDEEEAREDYPPDPDDPGAGDIVTGSMFWPINPDVDEEVQALSKQLVYTMYDELSEQERANYTRYPGGIFAGIARNGHGLAGYGSVLFELSQGTLGDREFRIRQSFTALLAALDATADGSLYEVDPDGVDELPERGDTFPV